MTRTRVYLHIGEPKCGTTFLQDVLWRNRAELARYGVTLPGTDGADHYRAAQDLRDLPQDADDPGITWHGAWTALARQARGAGGVAVITHELLIGADLRQARRAVECLAPAEVHVIVTSRDLASLLPAEWQETVKHRNARTWQEWLGDIIDTPPRRRRPRAKWFWTAHDTVAVLRRWSEVVPRERVHLVTVPRTGAPPDLLWRRFASVLGIADAPVDFGRVRANASLGLSEVELLRRLNARLSELPQWFYARNVKNTLAHTVLAGRSGAGRVAVPAERHAWVREQSARRVQQLGALGVDIVGDLGELDAPDVIATEGDPSAASDADLLDAALDVLAHTIERRYEHARKPPRMLSRSPVVARWGPTVKRIGYVARRRLG
ncbi:MAG TPA: hypothetical protein VHE56_09000 [Mycobacteriales bacterium]|nr:hypothetical protein [Mycobacteriales bacterium]